MAVFNWLKNLFKRQEWTVNRLVTDCRGSLVSLQFKIQNAIVYRKDKEGEGFKKPDVTLKDGYGDCEDYARVWYECLVKMGYKPKMYNCINHKKRNHAINLFQVRGKWCYTSNGHFISTNVTDKDDALKYAYPAERYEVII